MLVKLIYSSHVSDVMKPGDIQKILEAARRRNAENSITGILCHGNHRFIQCVEGERDAVNELYGRLIKDPRHENLILLDYRPIYWRSFRDWSMGFVTLRDADIQGVVKKITKRDQFLTEGFSASEAFRLLKTFKKRLNPQYPTRAIS